MEQILMEYSPLYSQSLREGLQKIQGIVLKGLILEQGYSIADEFCKDYFIGDVGITINAASII